PNVPANFGPVRARVTCIVDGRTISGESEPIVVPANGVVNIPKITFGQVTPIPLSLAVSAAPGPLTSPGATRQLAVTARYSDGTTKDVSTQSAGTTFTISNAAIATVDANGLVAAVATGTVLVQAIHEGAQGMLTLSVALDVASPSGIPES